MTPAPAAKAQLEHRWAVALADQVMAEAQRRGQRVAVAIADHRGDPVQQDWMPGAPPRWPWPRPWPRRPGRSSAPAPSWPRCYPGWAGGPARGGCSRSRSWPRPAGLPVEEDGRVVAGLGVAGRDPGACEEIAAAVLAAAGRAGHAWVSGPGSPDADLRGRLRGDRQPVRGSPGCPRMTSRSGCSTCPRRRCGPSTTAGSSAPE